MPGWNDIEEILYPKSQHKKDLERMFSWGVIAGLVMGFLAGIIIGMVIMTAH